MDFKNILTQLDQLNEGVEVVAEKAESKNQATAARIALKHKKEGTKPKAGTASAEMMKMSKSDLEDFTKAKKGAPKKKTNESFEESELRRLAGLPEASIQEADMDLSDKTEELTQWVLKYDGYRGDNGDDLPMGWIKSMTATGVGPDGWEVKEWNAYQDKLGKDITDMDDAEIDAFIDDPQNSPVTSAMIDDLLKITGASEADEDLARAVSSAIGIGESLEEEADIDLSKYSKEMLDQIKNASDAELNKMAVEYGGSSMEIGREEELFRKIRAQLKKQDEGFDRGSFRKAFEAMVEAKAKPDYIDIDKDGDKKEPMKKAAKDAKKKKGQDVEEGKSPHKKGSKAYKKQMAAKHASMAESINESFEKFIGNEKMSFEEMVAVVQESGGQQKIDPVDNVLWQWANRVASSKGESEMYAAEIYESNGGRFELHDVLSED